MPKYKVSLIKVGRSKKSKTFIIEVPNLEYAITVASKECDAYLLSVETGFTETKKKGLFNVYAGFHTVGQVRIEKIK